MFLRLKYKVLESVAEKYEDKTKSPDKILPEEVFSTIEKNTRKLAFY